MLSLIRKGQSTAEYAITIGLVVAVVAGVMQVALKGGMRKKSKQALNFMMDAGDDALSQYEDRDMALYQQDYRTTQVDADSYADEYLMEKGGAEKRYQQRTSETTGYSVELMDEVQQ